MKKTEDRAEDALALLERDHRRVEDLFRRVERDPGLFDDIRQELEVHAAIEEEIFYPAVRAALRTEGQELVDEARREHDEVKTLLAELSDMSRRSEEFKDKLADLQNSVEHHVEEEEDEMWARVRESMTPETLSDLGERMRSRKEELKGTLA